MSQSEFEAITCKAREYARVQVAIGFGFAFTLWVEKVARVLLANHRATRCKTKANTISIEHSIENRSIAYYLLYSIIH